MILMVFARYHDSYPVVWEGVSHYLGEDGSTRTKKSLLSYWQLKKWDLIYGPLLDFQEANSINI